MTSVQADEDRSGGYIRSCQVTNFERTNDPTEYTMHATCIDDDDEPKDTSIVIGHCVGNDQGQLVYEKEYNIPQLH